MYRILVALQADSHTACSARGSHFFQAASHAVQARHEAAQAYFSELRFE